MAEIRNDGKIVVNGDVVGTVHEYIEAVRRIELGGDNNE